MTIRQLDGTLPSPVASAVYSHADTVRRIESWLGKNLPLLNDANISAFENGDIDLARFDVRAGLAGRIIRSTLKRAMNPTDNLYCLHAAIGHTGTYLEALEAISEGKIHVLVVKNRHKVGTPSNLRPRFAIKGETRERLSSVPLPLKRFLELRANFKSKNEPISILLEKTNIIANCITLICLGLHPKQFMTLARNSVNIVAGIMARGDIKDKLRTELGTLRPDVYNRLNDVLSAIYRTLIINDKPSYDPNVYAKVLDEIFLRFPHLTQVPDFGFSTFTHTVTPIAFLRSAAEIALDPKLGVSTLPIAFPEAIEAELMDQPTTDLITVYLYFHEDSKNLEIPGLNQ